MRAAPTASEAALWRALCAHQLGVEVRRQLVLGEFIADFVVPSAWLVIEVDGSAHRVRGAADARRDRRLAKLGYRVLRLGQLASPKFLRILATGSSKFGTNASPVSVSIASR